MRYGLIELPFQWSAVRARYADWLTGLIGMVSESFGNNAIQNIGDVWEV